MKIHPSITRQRLALAVLTVAESFPGFCLACGEAAAAPLAHPLWPETCDYCAKPTVHAAERLLLWQMYNRD